MTIVRCRASVEFPHLMHGRHRLLKQPPGSFHGDFPCFIQFDFIFPPHKQRHAEGILQVLHGTGDGGCGNVKFLGNTAQRTQLGESHKLTELIQVDHGGSFPAFQILKRSLRY